MHITCITVYYHFPQFDLHLFSVSTLFAIALHTTTTYLPGAFLLHTYFHCYTTTTRFTYPRTITLFVFWTFACTPIFYRYLWINGFCSTTTAVVCTAFFLPCLYTTTYHATVSLTATPHFPPPTHYVYLLYYYTYLTTHTHLDAITYHGGYVDFLHCVHTTCRSFGSLLHTFPHTTTYHLPTCRLVSLGYTHHLHTHHVLPLRLLYTTYHHYLHVLHHTPTTVYAHHLPPPPYHHHASACTHTPAPPTCTLHTHLSTHPLCQASCVVHTTPTWWVGWFYTFTTTTSLPPTTTFPTWDLVSTYTSCSVHLHCTCVLYLHHTCTTPPTSPPLVGFGCIWFTFSPPSVSVWARVLLTFSFYTTGLFSHHSPPLRSYRSIFMVGFVSLHYPPRF